MKNKIIIILAIVLILLDQLIKILVTTKNIEPIGKTIQFGQFENEYTADIGEKLTFLLTNCLVFFVIIRFIVKQNKNLNTGAKVSLAMIISGSVSNIIDKMVKSKVIHCFNINSLSFSVSDFILIIGWILFLIFMVQSTMKTAREIKDINFRKENLKMDIKDKE